jgi:hypothetical protein
MAKVEPVEQSCSRQTGALQVIQSATADDAGADDEGIEVGAGRQEGLP